VIITCSQLPQNHGQVEEAKQVHLPASNKDGHYSLIQYQNKKDLDSCLWLLTCNVTCPHSLTINPKLIFFAPQKEPSGNIFMIKCVIMAILHVNILIPPQPTQLIKVQLLQVDIS